MPRNIYGKPIGEKREKGEGKKEGELKDMARTKAEKKEANSLVMPKESEPDYPYGLRVHLDHESLKKAGITELPKAGEEMHFTAKARVHSASSESRDGGEEHRLELQITHMGIHHKPDDMKSEETQPRKRH